MDNKVYALYLQIKYLNVMTRMLVQLYLTNGFEPDK